MFGDQRLPRGLDGVQFLKTFHDSLGDLADIGVRHILADEHDRGVGNAGNVPAHRAAVEVGGDDADGLPGLGGDALEHLVGYGEPLHLGVEHEFLNVGLLAGAEGQVGVQGAVLEHTHAVVGGNGGVCAAPFRDVVVGVPYSASSMAPTTLCRVPLAPRSRRTGSFFSMSSSNVFTGRSAETMMDRREVSFMLASEATFLRGFLYGALPSRAATVLKVWVRVTSAAFCSRRRGC